MSSKNDNLKKIKIKNKKEAFKALNRNTNQNNKIVKKRNDKKNNKIKISTKKNTFPNKLNVTADEVKKIKTNKKNNQEKNKKVFNGYSGLAKDDKNLDRKYVYKPENSKKQQENLSVRIKQSIFEEVDTQTIKKERKLRFKIFGKKSIAIGLLFIIIALIILLVIGLKGNLKKVASIYKKYEIGEEVYLNDNSKWYVINDDGKMSDVVTLLKASQLDINNDGIFDENDKMQLSSKGKVDFDLTEEGTVYNYLENTYKKYLDEKVVKVETVSLINSKDYIKVRNYMNYGYEWTDGNFLANNELGIWWINTVQNDKVFAVGPSGSYRLYYSTQKNYVRPTIVVKKDLLD